MSNALQLPKAVEDAVLGLGQASRRSFLKASGALVISLSVSTLPGANALAAEPAAAAGPYPDPDFLQLDTWIVIHPDNTATFYVGKTDGGQGTGTAFRQMMCDELDIAYDKTRLVMGCTDITPDQGGSGGSDGVERDGLDDAPGGRRSAAGAAGTGWPAPGRAGRNARGGQRHHCAEVRSCEEGDLRRTDRRQAFQRRAHRTQRRRRNRQGRSEAGQ